MKTPIAIYELLQHWQDGVENSQDQIMADQSQEPANEAAAMPLPGISVRSAILAGTGYAPKMTLYHTCNPCK